MDTYFVIRRGKLTISLLIFIGFIFTFIGGSFTFQFLPLFNVDIGGVNPRLFLFIPVIAVIVGIGLIARAIYMMFNNKLITAGSRTIQFKKETYAVDRIKQFRYASHFRRGRNNNYYSEDLYIGGEDGMLRLDITHTNMRTKEILDLFRKHYPSIPLIAE